MLTITIITVAIGYLLGSIPFAYIAGRLIKGIDIRQAGGGNVGALNTIREIGLLPGLLVLLADMAKGSAAVLIAQWLGVSLVPVFVAGFAAIVGHNFPVFLKFRGGKGAATTIGVLIPLAPLESAIALGIILIIIVITSNVRLAVSIGLVLFPVIIWQLNGSIPLIVYALALALALLIRSLTSIKEAAADSSKRKGLIFDRDYHFWQTKKGK